MDTALALELWFDALEAEGRTTATLANYRLFTRPLPGLAPVLLADSRASLREYLATYRRTHKPDSVRTVFVAWRSFFNWCVREGLTEASPMDGMRAPRVPEATRDAYSQGQMRALFAHLASRHTPIGLRNHAIGALLFDCGLRASELCRLTLDDLMDGCLIVRESKSGRPRVSPIGASAHKALTRYLAHGRAPLKPRTTHVFVNQFGQPFNRYGLRQVLHRVGEAVGFRLYAHRMRHTWATAHLRGGTPTETLRRLGGWSGYEMVRRYAHLSTGDLKAAQAAASPLDHL